MTKAIFVCSMLLFSGCITVTGTVTESVRNERVTNRAKWDFDCPDGKILVQKIDDTAFGASGCGKKALYVLDKCHGMNWASVCKAVLNSEVRSVEQKQP